MMEIEGVWSVIGLNHLMNKIKETDGIWSVRWPKHQGLNNVMMNKK